MVLGDNIFYGNGFTDLLKNAAEDAQKGKATVRSLFTYTSWVEVKTSNSIVTLRLFWLKMLVELKV